MYKMWKIKKMKTRVDATFKMASNDTNNPFDVRLSIQPKIPFLNQPHEKPTVYVEELLEDRTISVVCCIVVIVII